jgi:hypothetical protein
LVGGCVEASGAEPTHWIGGAVNKRVWGVPKILRIRGDTVSPPTTPQSDPAGSLLRPVLNKGRRLGLRLDLSKARILRLNLYK